ncbi:MauE/DoxX family redox-associated membrane protein [Shimia ponticola]|uniref:MauE/DoxX family redox-associated membrane protein n=1 Tax=Shimia ponticola TaxID=2582893 RepID=UPI0011BD684B|nr:MauE/DoxX family redox-associated membrane protein [Shimia ponticola]
MATYHVRQDGRGSRIADYWPLIALVGVSAAAGGALAAQGMAWMPAFMGVFLCVFALLKIFDLQGFRRGFKMYDLLARRVPNYALVYPFIELGLGLAYLSGLAPQVTQWVTIAVFGFGTLGVLSALRRGLDIDCPCMGSILSVPLSTVTLTEDLSMVAMAAFMIIQAA